MTASSSDVSTREAMSVRNGRRSSTSIPIVARGSVSRAHSATAIVRLWLTEPDGARRQEGSAARRGEHRLGRLHTDGGERRPQRDPSTDPPGTPRLRQRARERRLHGVKPGRQLERAVRRQRHPDAGPERKVEHEPALEGHRYLAATSAATSARTCASSASLPTETGSISGRRRASQTTCQVSAPPGSTVS